MTVILNELPYYDAVTYANVNHQVVQLLPHQIIVWISLSFRDVIALHGTAPRFPVVLDTGSNFGFAISEKHLDQWSGLTREALEQLGTISINRFVVPRLAAGVWLHPNKKGERDVFRSARSFLLDLRDGIAVYPRAADLPTPRLPMLGMRAIDENRLQCFIYGERMRVTLRTAPTRRRSEQAGKG